MQPQLDQGECAIIYVKHDDPDDFAIVLFDHLFPGDQIFVTDNSYLTGCSDTCYYSSDGDCQDGGPGSEFVWWCTFGTDCSDCGPRPLRSALARPI